MFDPVLRKCFRPSDSQTCLLGHTDFSISELRILEEFYVTVTVRAQIRPRGCASSSSPSLLTYANILCAKVCSQEATSLVFMGKLFRKKIFFLKDSASVTHSRFWPR